MEGFKVVSTKMEDDPLFHTLLAHMDAETKKVAEACKVLLPLAITFEQPTPTSKESISTPEVVLDWFAGDPLRNSYFVLCIIHPGRSHPRSSRRFRRSYMQRDRAYYLFYLGRGPIDRAVGQFGSAWIQAVRCLLLYHGGLHLFLCERCRERYTYTLAQGAWERDTL